MEETDYSAWIGRSEEAEDIVTPSPLNRLSATLDRNDPPHAPGTALPPLAHWLYFLPDAPQSGLGADGHPMRGGFLPPVHELPRRMWAGSRITFAHDIPVGATIHRRSTIAAATRKQGASGPLVLVTVRHEISGKGGPVAIVDEHDIVYRGLQGPAAKTLPDTAAAPKGEWRRTLTPDPVLLFRYSALTFNGHRIHYDRDYVTKEEGYPGLVVHGPLIATLLVDLVRRNLPQRRIAAFSFRAASPLFDGRPMSVNADLPDADGRIRLWAADAAGRTCMTAQVQLDMAGERP
ncbi:3-methylfumaryl-CoA hydratase [Aquamicrobium terrae]